jgi:gamma-glutamyltranspeptidase / glutathione hydrolase
LEKFGTKLRYDRSCIATGNVACTMAAKQILEIGGNAFDAVVGATLMACVAEPMLASLGGGGYCTLKTGDGKHAVYDFFVAIPGIGEVVKPPILRPLEVQFVSATQTFHVGRGSVAVPGVLKGLLKLHGELGRIPLKSVLEPAIIAARCGVALDKTQAYVLVILDPIMRQCAQAKTIYECNNQLRCEGQLIINPAFADFLEDLPKSGDREFYEGQIAQRFVSDLSSESQLSLIDLSRYEVIVRQPIVSNYRDYKVYTNPLPAMGGVMIANALSKLEKIKISDYALNGSEHLTILGDLLERIENEKTDSFPISKKGTTHISVSDTFGNFASLSLSNGEGSGYMVPGTGIMLNNMLGEDDIFPADPRHLTPGSRIGSMMAPTLLEKNAGHNIVIGSGGSKRIRSSLLQVISNIIDFDLPLAKAVTNPRLNWDGSTMQLEPGFSPSAVGGLGKKYKTNVWPHLGFYFGGTHGVIPGDCAVGDPRRGGSAVSVKQKI